jgi:hypothetical protein
LALSAALDLSHHPCDLKHILAALKAECCCTNAQELVYFVTACVRIWLPEALSITTNLRVTGPIMLPGVQIDPYKSAAGTALIAGSKGCPTKNALWRPTFHSYIDSQLQRDQRRHLFCEYTHVTMHMYNDEEGPVDSGSSSVVSKDGCRDVADCNGFSRSSKGALHS